MDHSKNITSKSFCRIGFALFAMAALTNGLQALLYRLPDYLSAGSESFWNSGWYIWIMTFVPLYLVGVPASLWIMKKVPCESKASVRLGGKNFFIFLLMSCPLVYGGNLIGTLLSSLLSGGSATNSLFSYAFDDNPLKLIVMVILAPLIEEYIFRRQLIDRTARYGEKQAVLFSALCFALFHMNLYQFFYAFGLGLLFGYVYIRTRRLRYSVIIHMIINFLGTVLVPLLLSNVGLENFTRMAAGEIDEAELLALLPGLAGYLLYVIGLICLSVTGFIILLVKVPKLVFLHTAEELPKGERFKTVYCNAGVILFTLICGIFITKSFRL